MAINKKRWFLDPIDYGQQFEIAQKLNISHLLAQLCMKRGFETPDIMRNFLYISSKDLHDPYCFSEMKKAVSIIEAALCEEVKILIYGDYDVDGITGTSLLYDYLKNRNAQVDFYIPDRNREGYGLNNEAIFKAFKENYRLIITIDCGISSVQETARAKSLGFKVIITDHHQPPEVLPQADAIINPQVSSSGYPFAELAGVGVAWKLAQALHISMNFVQKEEMILGEYLDLVCLGTVADVVPLVGENRILVSLGLNYLVSCGRPGLKALLEVCDLKGKKISTSEVGFILAPRLNAVGRLSHAKIGVELLTCSDYHFCLSTAHNLNQENSRRRDIENLILQQALQIIEEKVNLEEDHILVLASEDWHPGVIGIVASRLVERFNRPVVLLSIEGDVAKGSARSIEGFDIYSSLAQCQEFLLQFGGHKQAAGLKVSPDNISGLRAKLNEIGRMILTKEMLIPVEEIDAVIEAEENLQEILNDVELMAPFGFGNEHPVFAMWNLKVMNARGVGTNSRHLKITLVGNGLQFDGIGFNMAAYLNWIVPGIKVDVAFILERNQWNGLDKVQLVLRDIQPHPVFTFSRARQNGDAKIREFIATNSDDFIISSLEKGTNVAAFLPLNRFRKLLYSAAANHLINSQGQTIVLCSCPSYLWSEYVLAEIELHKLGITVGIGYSLMPGEEKGLIRKAFCSGRINVLFATPEFIQSWEHWERRQGEILFIVGVLDLLDTVWDSDCFLKQCRKILKTPVASPLMVCSIISEESVQKALTDIFKEYLIFNINDPVQMNINDARERNNPLDYLQGLLKAGESCLVYTTFRHQMDDLTKRIKKSGIIPPEKTISCYGSQQPWYHRMITEKVRAGLVQLVTTTCYFGCNEVDYFDHLVFFYPPRNLFDFYRFAGGFASGEKPKIHLLYSKQDLDFSEQILKTNYPNREMLGKIYRVIQNMLSEEGKIEGTGYEINRRMVLAGKKQWKEATVEVGLSIMIELGLIKRYFQGNRFSLAIEKYDKKYNLVDSFCYREGMREKNAAYSWKKVAMSLNLTGYLTDMLG